ncbi:hypothetical protein ACP0HM_05095 [Escherichia coli]
MLKSPCLLWWITSRTFSILHLVPIENIAAFPTITESTEIQTLEEYDQDATGKLAGYRKLESTTLVVNRVLMTNIKTC